MTSRTITATLLKTVALVVFFAAAAGAQNTLTITAAPGLVNFALPPSGTASGSSPITVTTIWQIQQGGTVVSLYAYFVTPAQALRTGAGGPNNQIPSSNVLGQVGAGPFTSFTGNGPFSTGGSLLIFSQQVRGNKNVTRNDTLNLRINTAGLNLQPGTYTGVLRIQAQAI